MDTLRLVDVGVFFTFFLLLFVRPLFFFFFGGGACNFLLPNCPIASTIRSAEKKNWTLCGVFFLSFVGASVPLHS